MLEDFLSNFLGRPCKLQKKTERGLGRPGVLVRVGGDPSRDILVRGGGGAPSRDLLLVSFGISGGNCVGAGSEKAPGGAGVGGGVRDDCGSDFEEFN